MNKVHLQNFPIVLNTQYSYNKNLNLMDISNSLSREERSSYSVILDEFMPSAPK